MAVWRICTSPAAGLPGSTSSRRRTSGPPFSSKRMARGMRASLAHGYPAGVAGSAQGPLQRAVVGLPGADADDPLDVGDEDLAVTDLAGLRGLHDRLDDLIDQIAP